MWKADSMSGSEWKQRQWAEDWPSFREGLSQAVDAERLLLDSLLPNRADRILDLGCGDGRMIAVLRERWPDASAVGLDLSPGLVEAARQRFGGAAEVRIET
jgi:trans-aconitate methyltransferase